MKEVDSELYSYGERSEEGIRMLRSVCSSYNEEEKSIRKISDQEVRSERVEIGNILNVQYRTEIACKFI